MVSRYYITRNLKSLNQKYRRAKTQAEPLYYSKLAIIELCGWIETSIDEIFGTCSPGLVNEPRYLKKVTEKLDKTYGFSEKKHLQPLIISLVGYNGLQKIEASCDATKFGNLNRNLNELTTMRNNLAHTYIKGFATTIDSPQLTLIRLNLVAEGLDHLEGKISELSGKLNTLA